MLLIGLQNHMGANAEAKCVTINQRRPELIAIGANDVYARVYDRRMISLSPVSTCVIFDKFMFFSVYFHVDFITSDKLQNI